MNIKTFKDYILKLRDSGQSISNERANALWSRFKDSLSDEDFISVVMPFVHGYEVLSELEVKLAKKLPEPVVEKEESVREDLGFKPDLPPIEVERPESKYCCNYGVVLKRDKGGYTYVFRCQCHLAKFVSSAFPMWSDSLKDTYLDF